MSYDIRERYGHAYDISILAETAVERLRADGGLVANDTVARWFGLPPVRTLNLFSSASTGTRLMSCL